MGRAISVRPEALAPSCEVLYSHRSNHTEARERRTARVTSEPETMRVEAVWSRPPAFESGGGGLVSTADDFLAFGRMMLDFGRHGRERILSRPSVELMTADQLTPAQKAASPFFPGFWDHNGWGFGVSVVTKRAGLADTPGRYGWDGGFGTSWRNDPREDLTAIFLMQRLMRSPDDIRINEDFLTLAYQAIDD